MLFIICGHGAGDPGACGNGYQEAERVRTLADRIKALGGGEVTVGDTSKNWYNDKLVNNTNIPKGAKVLELHMDSNPEEGPHGAHVIIDADFEPDKWDIALAEFISGILPGRSEIIVKRNNLANPNRAQAAGINYRLLECGFISNPGDVEIFNTRMDEIAKGILGCFEIAVKEEKVEPTPVPAEPTKSLDDWAKEIIAGLHGDGHAKREASLKEAGCEFDYQTVRNRVNELCGVKTSTKPVSNCYPKYTGKSYGIDTVFRAIGVPEAFCGKPKNRKPIAEKNGVKNYKGTQDQNLYLIGLAKQGKLKRV